MSNVEILGLFPSPVYRTQIDKKLTEKELSVISNCAKDKHSNQGNNTSKDSYILNNSVFSDLKKEFKKHINDYFDKIICPHSNQSITPYITQSWLNWTKTEEYHHRHSHANSLVSGVYYIDVDSEKDKINFYKHFNHEHISLEVKEGHHNEFNSTSWWLPIKTGELLLFPSSLEHGVDLVKSEKTRISLAFNVFIKGVLGSNEKKTELEIA